VGRGQSHTSAAACCLSPIRCIRRMIRGSRRSGKRPRPRKLRPGERSTPARRDYRRLAFTAHEAAQILAEFPPAQVDQLVGLNATRERLLSLDWSKYRFIHIATHGIVDAQVPQLSALILGSYDASGNVVDGAVRVADLSLQTLKADVAVFSACDTALGRQVPSEGLVGISSTVLARGARAVVASLWPVSDEIGARLMTEFYRHLLHDSMSAPAALGAAMRSVVSRDGSADPALWAAFQVSVVALGPGLPTRNAGTAEVPTTTRPGGAPSRGSSLAKGGHFHGDAAVAHHPAALPYRRDCWRLLSHAQICYRKTVIRFGTPARCHRSCRRS